MHASQEQLELRQVAQRFARERLLPGYQKRDSQQVLDRALVRQLGELGLIGVDIPDAFGGLGLGSVAAGMILEEVAYADINVSYVLLFASLMGAIMARNAQPHIAREWVGRIVKGQAIVGLGLTEPRGGSDSANLRLKAERVADGYLLTGEKTSITFANQADALVVWARTGSVQEGAKGVSAFLVPLDLPGIQRTGFEDSGARSVGRGSIFLEKVHVPLDHLLGAEGTGFTQVMQGFDFSRILITLQCLAAAQASLDETWHYAGEREAFGAPIVQYQGVSFPLVEAESRVAAYRQLCYYALELRDQGLSHTTEAAMVKAMGPKAALDAIHECILTFGHAAVSMDLPHQQRLRDVQVLEIADGTTHIMKLIVARARAGRAAVQYMRNQSATK